MLELVLVIVLCIVAIIFSLWLIGYGICHIGDYKFMSKEDYCQLNGKAKRINKLRQAKKCNQPRRKGLLRRLWDSLSDSSSLPGPIRRAMGHPF